MPAVEFAHCERQLFSRLSALGFSPRVVFDVGGSNAAWSTSLRDVFPEASFELFEPLAGLRPDYDRVLEWALRNNPSFRLHNIALGESNGHAPFWSEPAGVGSSLLVGNVPAEQKINVPIRRLDDFVAEKRLPQPQVIKVDVQGGELQVIRGGLKTFEAADMLHLESWLTRGYGKQTPLLPELMDALRPLGFVLVQIGDFWRRPDQELASVDAFFAHRRLIQRLAEAGDGFPWPANWSPEY